MVNFLRAFILISLLFFYFPSASQELEPRALTNIPTGMNFAVAGYAYAKGNILFDPALPIDDAKANLHTFAAAYLRSINFFGMAGKVDVVVPYGIGIGTAYIPVLIPPFTEMALVTCAFAYLLIFLEPLH
jgi:hypothetical protein